MDYIYDVLKLIISIITIIIGTIMNFIYFRILMEVANYVGEKLGFSRFFIYLWQKKEKFIQITIRY